MSEIRTPPATKEYREGWERVFGKGITFKENLCPVCTKNINGRCDADNLPTNTKVMYCSNFRIV